MCRPIKHPRRATTDVQQDEAESSADGSVGTPALTKDVVASIHSQFPSEGTVEDQQWSTRMGGALHRVEVELPFEQSLNRGNDNREVLGQAAGHHRIDGEFLDRGDAVFGRHRAKFVLRVTVSPGQELFHPLRRRRNNRQPIGPALVVEPVVDRFERVVQGDCVRMEIHTIVHCSLSRAMRERARVRAYSYADARPPICFSFGFKNRERYSWASFSAGWVRMLMTSSATAAAFFFTSSGRLLARG